MNNLKRKLTILMIFMSSIAPCCFCFMIDGTEPEPTGIVMVHYDQR